MTTRNAAGAPWVLTFIMVVGLGGAFSPVAEAAILNADGSPMVGDPNLVGWWKADAGVWSDTAGTVAATNGTAVARWDNQANSAMNATQTVAGDQPIFRQSEARLGGTAALDFVSADRLFSDVVPATNNDDRTLIAVFVDDQGGTTSPFYAHVVHYGSSLNPWGAFGITAHTANQSTGGTTGNSAAGNLGNHYWGRRGSSGRPPSDEATIFTSDYELATKTNHFYGNGMDAGAVSITAGLVTGSVNGIVIGGIQSHGSNEAFDGLMAEVIAYDTVLTASERRSVEQYLSSKYSMGTLPSDLTTAGGVEAKYVVGLGRVYSDTVIPVKAPNGIVDYGSHRGNSQPWWQINDGVTTFQNVNTFGGSDPDFAGYLFKVPVKNISQIDFFSNAYGDGGTFDSTPTVQYLDAPLAQGGQWHDLAVTWGAPYDRNYGGLAVRPYLLVPQDQAIDGVWGIRIIGPTNATATPDGSGGFIGLSELRVYGQVDLRVDFRTNLALQSNGATAIMNHAQYGNPAAINDGNLLTREQTWGVIAPEDFVGVTWQTPQHYVNAVGITFKEFSDGGLFDDAVSPMRIEVTYDGSTWVPVTGLDKHRYPEIYPTLISFGTPGGIRFDPEQGFLFTFDSVSNILGIRAIGDPYGVAGADTDGFLGVFEFEVFANVPEPSSMMLLAFGGLGLVGLVWRRRKRSAT